MKLTGFALAGLFDPSLGENHVENLLHATCGTPDYTAPEVSLVHSLTDYLVFGKQYDGCSSNFSISAWSRSPLAVLFIIGCSRFCPN